MSYSLVTSENFVRELKRLTKKYPSLKQDVSLLGENLSENQLKAYRSAETVIKSGWRLKAKDVASAVVPALSLV